MKKIEKQTTAILAIVSTITLFPVGLLTIDLYGAYIARLSYSPWLHWSKSLWTIILLHAALVICCRALLYSFDRRLKINTDLSMAEMVGLPLLLLTGIGLLVIDADVYFSTIGHHKYSTLFHLNTASEVAQATSVLCPVFSAIPFIIVFIHTYVKSIIVLEKKDRSKKSLPYQASKDFSKN